MCEISRDVEGERPLGGKAREGWTNMAEVWRSYLEGCSSMREGLELARERKDWLNFWGGRKGNMSSEPVIVI